MSAASCPALVWAIPLPSGCGTGGRACENLPCASETECVPGHEFPAKGIDGFHDSRRMRELGGLYLPCDSHMEPADPWRSAPMTCLPPLFALPKEALASLAQNKRGHAPSASTGMAAFSVCFFRPLGGRALYGDVAHPLPPLEHHQGGNDLQVHQQRGEGQRQGQGDHPHAQPAHEQGGGHGHQPHVPGIQ